MTYTNDNEQAIRETVNFYFQGTYHGNRQYLEQAFHSQARIVGKLNEDVYDWSLSDFITRVTSQPTSAEKQEKYDKSILFIDITGDTAIVKAQAQVSSYTFIDYITLMKMESKWLIRYKSFTT